MKKIVSKLRRDFPMLSKTVNGHPLIYFDSAATAHKPEIVIQTLKDFYSENYGTVHRAVYELSRNSTESYHGARQKIQSFLNARFSEEIVFTRGTTAAINLVARSFGKAFLHPGDRIVISQIEHHSNIVPWQMLCEEMGTELCVVPVNEHGELVLEVLESILDQRVKLVSVAHVSNSIGTLNPIEAIVRMAHSVGAKVLVDGAQAAPHLPIDVRKLGVDFYAFSGHKTYGPTGVGVLYGKYALLEKMPPIEGGGDMIERVSFVKTSYTQPPIKFEAGTPMIAEVIALGAAIDYLSGIGLEKIFAWEKELLNHATQKLQSLPGLRIIGTAAQKGAIISFTIDGVHPLDLATLLDCYGIAIRTGNHCSQPTLDRFGVPATARISFGLYNTKEEIDRFVDVMQTVLPSLR